jgi:hypothetical protein
MSLAENREDDTVMACNSVDFSVESVWAKVDTESKKKNNRYDLDILLIISSKVTGFQR